MISTDEDDDGNHASVPSSHPERAKAPAPATANKYGNPADRPMPFGKTKGKKLGDHTTDELEKVIAWCNEKDAEKFADFVETVGQVLDDRLVGAALKDEADDLPF